MSPIPFRRSTAPPTPATGEPVVGPIVYSPEQDAVRRWVQHGTGNAFVEAVAGSGKTTTIVGACGLMRGTVAFAAFNKKIADELRARIPNRQVAVGTFHSFGFRAWSRGREVTVDAERKRWRMLDQCTVPKPLRRAVPLMVSVAKQSMVGRVWQPTDEDAWREVIAHHDVLLLADEGARIDDLIEYAERCVVWSSLEERQIDYDDMLWLPLLSGVPFERRDWVVVDEAQDTNVARRMLAQQMLARGGRALFVGDRHQSIYGFTGADSDAVDLIFQHFDPCTPLPLTYTFRCSKAATKLAQRWVPQITAAESNAEGRVLELSAAEFRALVPKPGPQLVTAEPTATTTEPTTVTAEPPRRTKVIGPGDAILCRNTKPLVTMAWQLIRAGVRAHVEGRKIGDSLRLLVDRWKVSTIAELGFELARYQQREEARLLAEKDGAGYQIEALADRLDTVRVLMEGCDTLDALRRKINELFADTDDAEGSNRVTLSTVHKAKGREWNRVFVLGWHELMPSRHARQAWQQQQERNIQYVAATRTKGELVLVPLAVTE